MLLAYLPACHSWRAETVTPQALIETKHPGEVRAVRADGTKQVLHQPAVVGDTLRGTAQEPAIPLSDVQAVETRHGDTGKTLLLGLGIAVGVVAAAAIACAATNCLDIHLWSSSRAAAMR